MRKSNTLADLSILALVFLFSNSRGSLPDGLGGRFASEDPSDRNVQEYCLWRDDGLQEDSTSWRPMVASRNDSYDDKTEQILHQWVQPHVVCCSHGYSGEVSGDLNCPEPYYVEELGDLSLTYCECCFPRLRHMLQKPAPDWLAVEVKRLAASFEYPESTLDAFEAECASKPSNTFVRFRAEGLYGVRASVDLDLKAPVWHGSIGYLTAVLRALRILRFWAPQGALDDLDIFVAGTDCVLSVWPVPVYGQTRLREFEHAVGILPHEWLLTWRARNQAMYEQLDLAWEDKEPIVFWRGAAVSAFCQYYDLGLGWDAHANATPDMLDPAGMPCSIEPLTWLNATFRNWWLHPRGRLALLAEFAPDIMDVRFGVPTGSIFIFNEPDVTLIRNYLEKRGLVADHHSDLGELSTRPRYLITVDFSDRIYELLQINAVVLIAEINLERALISHKLFRPFEHFLPIKADLSDVLEKVRWAEANPKLASAIAERGSQLARELFSHEDMLHVMYRVVEAHTLARRANRGKVKHAASEEKPGT